MVTTKNRAPSYDTYIIITTSRLMTHPTAGQASLAMMYVPYPYLRSYIFIDNNNKPRMSSYYKLNCIFRLMWVNEPRPRSVAGDDNYTALLFWRLALVVGPSVSLPIITCVLLIVYRLLLFWGNLSISRQHLGLPQLVSHYSEASM